MSTPPIEPTAHPPTEGANTEWLLRAFAVLFYLWACVSLGFTFVKDPTRWSILVLLIAEGYTLALVVTARRASVRDLTPMSVAATMYAAFFFVLFRTDTVHYIPEAVAVTIQLVALVWEVAAKVTLGRSFGLLPAKRTVVLGGPYRFVRHPIYFGYLVHHIGFILANWHWQNLMVIAVLTLVQVYRIQREELVLATSEEYRAFQERVRWRLVPFVW